MAGLPTVLMLPVLDWCPTSTMRVMASHRQGRWSPISGSRVLTAEAAGTCGVATTVPTVPTMRADCLVNGPFAAVRETHIGVVFLIGELAYKLKKPVRTTFLDYSTRPR